MIYKIQATFKLLFWCVLINAIYWMIGSFIALDINPMNWWLFTSTTGRIIVIILEIQVLVSAIKIEDL